MACQLCGHRPEAHREPEGCLDFIPHPDGIRRKCLCVLTRIETPSPGDQWIVDMIQGADWKAEELEVLFSPPKSY